MTDPSASSRVEFLGLEFDNLSLRQAVDGLLASDPGQPFTYVVTPNVDHIVRLNRESDRRDAANLITAYRRAAMCLCDSRILTLLARRVGVDVATVPGSDLTQSLLAALPVGASICLIGGDETAPASLRERFPHLQIVQHRPPMGMRHNPVAMEEAADFVAKADARFTFLAIGSPQQELLARRIAEKGEGKGIGLCIGASIDFLTGRARRAPLWMQRSHLEWAHRLAGNPRRMWRRYLVDGPEIFRLVRDWQRQKGH